MPVCHIFNTTGDLMLTFSTDDFGSRIVIGRASSCDVSLKRFAANNVSREHIRLERKGEVWQITNIGHSGLHLNGKKIKTGELFEGAVYRFSKLFLGVGVQGQPTMYEVNWKVMTDDLATRAAIWPGVNVVGASADNEITVRTDNVSRKHGLIICNDNRLLFENLSEFSKSYINGVSVGDKTMPLQLDDTLTLGETPITVATRFKTQAFPGASSSHKQVINPKQLRLIRLLALLIILGSLFILGSLCYLIWVNFFL